jgi:histidinol phosphatase-like PHP family hydrolase
MIIHSDWHIHSEASYDSRLPISEIERKSLEFGFEKFGITDHLNFNDGKFIGDLKRSVELMADLKKRCDRAILGVELTPIEKPLFDYIAKHGNYDGYVAPVSQNPYEIELAMSKEELKALGVRYAVGASHWRVDTVIDKSLPPDLDGCIKEWFRQQIWLACDERVTVLGHPWYQGKGLWYEDFSVIPRSMNSELAAALLENKKYIECNSHFFNSSLTTEKFRRQYAEFLRELFEMGIPVTYGSDSHNSYKPSHINTEKYLLDVGFADGDITEIAERDLW